MLSRSTTFVRSVSQLRRDLILKNGPPIASAATSNNMASSLMNRYQSSSTNAPSPSKWDEQTPRGFYPVYVHNVSRLVLEHLQENRSEWCTTHGLDRRLNINPNGTFSMCFPAKKGHDSGRIWTSYDSAHKQHWLSVYRQKLAVRFLLKEYGPSSPKVHDASTTERQIAKAVDQMILAVNNTESLNRSRR